MSVVTCGCYPTVVPHESVCFVASSLFCLFLSEQQVLWQFSHMFVCLFVVLFSKSHPELVIHHHDERSQGWTHPPPPLFL